MQQPNRNVAQKAQYSNEILNIVKHWGGNNPGNQDLFAKADASAVPADVPAQNGQVQQQQTVQKGSSSSDGSSSSSPSSSSGSSSSDGSSSSSDGSSTSSGSTSTSSGDSLSSLLSSVLTTLSDMQSSASGSSPSSSSDSSSGSSSSDKTSTDKNFPFQSGGSASSDKTSTDKNFGSSDVSAKTSTDKAISSVGSDSDSSGSLDEATKALSLALDLLLKAKKQPPTGQFPENGTQHAGAPNGGSDSVNGKPQEPDYNAEVHAKHPMPKGNTESSDNVNGSAQEPDYNFMAEKDASASMSKSIVNKDQYLKSIDQLKTLMTKIAEKVQTVEGKVDSLPNVRKGYAMTKNFTEDEQAEIVKNQQTFKDMEAKILADPKLGFKDVHKFRSSDGKILPNGYSYPS